MEGKIQVDIDDSGTQMIFYEVETPEEEPLVAGEEHLAEEEALLAGEEPLAEEEALVARDEPQDESSINMEERVSVPIQRTPTKIDKTSHWVVEDSPLGGHQRAYWRSYAEAEQDSIAYDASTDVRTEGQQESDVTESQRDEDTSTKAVLCPFCKVVFTNSKNFKRHLMRKHADQSPVKSMKKLEKSPSSRRESSKIVNSLRKLGRYELLQKEGKVVPCKLGKSTNVTCQFCKGIYSATNFKNHWRDCSQRPVSHVIQSANIIGSGTQKRTPGSEHCHVVPEKEYLADEKLKKTQNMIFRYVSQDACGRQALRDPLIVKVAAEKLPGIEHDQGRLDYFRRVVRDLSNLLTQIKDLDPTVKSLKDCFSCSKFDTIMEAVYKLSGTDYTEGVVEKTSYNTRLRHPLGAACRILMSETRKTKSGEERDLMIKEYQYFLAELESSWAKLFGTLAEREMKKKRHGKVISCADPDDVSRIFIESHGQIIDATNELLLHRNLASYDRLMRLLVLCMFCLCRRRAVDLQKLTVTDYKNIEKNLQLSKKVCELMEVPKSIVKDISELYCTFSCGKNQLATAIFFTEDMRKAMDAILEVRKYYNLKYENIFMQLSDKPKPWKVDAVLQWVKQQHELKEPENFGVRGLRHLTATVALTMTKDDPHVESIFREGLSHSEKVSRQHYRGNLPTRMIQGYGLPLLRDMQKRAGVTSTVTSTVTSQEDAADNQMEEGVTPREADPKIAEKDDGKQGQDADYNVADDEDDDDEEDFVKRRKKLRQPKKSSVCRTKWTDEEDAAIIRQFYKTVRMEKKVSNEEIEAAQAADPVLLSRTVAQIRTRLSQIRNKVSTTTKRLHSTISLLKSPDAKKYRHK